MSKDGGGSIVAGVSKGAQSEDKTVHFGCRDADREARKTLGFLLPVSFRELESTQTQIGHLR